MAEKSRLQMECGSGGANAAQRCVRTAHLSDDGGIAVRGLTTVAMDSMQLDAHDLGGERRHAGLGLVLR